MGNPVPLEADAGSLKFPFDGSPSFILAGSMSAKELAAALENGFVEGVSFPVGRVFLRPESIEVEMVNRSRRPRTSISA